MSKLQIENCRPVFLDADYLREPAYTLYRLNVEGSRFYYRYTEDKEVMKYISVTSLISMTLPTSPHLTKWIAGMGWENAEEYKTERARYGTLMHICIEQLLIAREFDLDSTEDIVTDYLV